MINRIIEVSAKKWFFLMALAAFSLSNVSAMAQAVNTQAPAAGTLRLEDFEKIALEKNPTITQAGASVRAARGRAKQAGLYPNPSAGPTGAEISGGPIIRGGEVGFFVQQEIVLGGKLEKSRRIVEQDVRNAETQAEAQKMRVLNSVRSLFYQALAAQRKVEVRTSLSALIAEASGVSKRLQNVGQADVPDVLEIEIEEQRAELALATARNEQAQIWQQLVSAAGDPSLKLAPVAGELEQLPELEMEAALNNLLQDSPEVKTAQTQVSRAEAVLERARVEKIPNIDIRSGLHYNRELLEAGSKPVGFETFFDVGLRIPLFDRNQGNVEAARAELDRAQREVDRVRLSLRTRLAGAFREYLNSRDAAGKYRAQMLPRAQRAYELYIANFRQMAAAYPQALIAQRTFFQLQEDYSDVLARVWSRAIEIRGLLLLGALDAPGSMESAR